MSVPAAAMGNGRIPKLLVATFAGIGLAAAFSVWLREATYGVRLFNDSLLYVSTARNLLAGNGWVIWSGNPYNGAGPLYPVALALVARLLRVDVVDAAGYVSASAFGVSVFFTSMWLAGRVRSRPLMIWAACTCALAAPMLFTATLASTDMLFVAFACGSMLALDRFGSTQRRSFLVAAAVAAAAGALTRYLGISLIGIGLLILVLQREGAAPSYRDRFASVAVWLAITGVPTGAWAIRDLIVPGLYYEVGLKGWIFPLLSLTQAARAVASWLYGNPGIDWLHGLAQRLTGISVDVDPGVSALVVTSALVLVPAVAAWLLLAGGSRGVLNRSRGVIKRNRDRLVVPLAFALGYACFLVVVSALVGTWIQQRVLTPMYPAVLVAASILIDDIAWRRQVSPSVKPSFGAVAASGRKRVLVLCSVWAWLVPHAIASWHDIASWNAEGQGYGSKQWIESETLSYLSPRLVSTRVYSNSHAALYFATGATDRIERFDSWSRMRPQLLALRATGEEVLAAVVYRDFWRRPYAYDLEDWDALPGYRVVAALEDGIVFGSDASLAASSLDDGGPPGGDTVAEVFLALLDSGRLVARSQFDVYASKTRDRLFYMRADCGTGADGYDGPRVFLHVFPVNEADLSPRWRRQGFEQRDFDVNDYGGSVGGMCFATRRLPPYPVASVRTGQVGRFGGDLEWTSEFAVRE